MINKYEVFKALSDETRLRLLNIFLVTRNYLCVCEMVDALQLPQYQVSRHLARLRHAGLLTVRKKGTWSHYWLNEEQEDNVKLFNFLENYLQGEPFESDRKRLKTRLLLRDENKCVIGFVTEEELNQLIKRKLGKTS